ncbi:hypothetical protein [Pseudomonas duriflava]|nr:hypothetical protein [Pseudomonas duriflava]
MSVIGVGMIHIATRVQQGQTDMHIQNFAVVQMRNLLHIYGTTLCPGNSNNSKASISSPIDDTVYPLNVECSDLMSTGIKLGGREITPIPQSVKLQTRPMDEAVFGLPIEVGSLETK